MVSLTRVRVAVAVSPGRNKSEAAQNNANTSDTADKRVYNKEFADGLNSEGQILERQYKLAADAAHHRSSNSCNQQSRNNESHTAPKKRRESAPDGPDSNVMASRKRQRNNTESIADKINLLNHDEKQEQKSIQAVAATARGSSSDDKQNSAAIRSPARNDSDMQASETTPIKHPLSMFISDCTQEMATKNKKSEVIDLTGAPKQLRPHRSFAPPSNNATSNIASSISTSNSIWFAKGGNNKWSSKILINGRTYYRQYNSEEEAAIDRALATRKFDVMTSADITPTLPSNAGANRYRADAAPKFNNGSRNQATTEVGAVQKMFGVDSSMQNGLIHYNFEAGGSNNGHLVTHNKAQSNVSCLGSTVSQPFSAPVPNPLPPQRKQDEHQLEHCTQKSNIESLLSSICESISYDIVEVWLHHYDESYHLVYSYISPKLDIITHQNVSKVYDSYAAGSAWQSHRLSCALCKWAKKVNKVIRVSERKFPHFAEALKHTINKAPMVIAVPVSQGSASLTVNLFRMTSCDDLTEGAENEQNNFLRLSSQKIMREVLANLASQMTLST